MSNTVQDPQGANVGVKGGARVKKWSTGKTVVVALLIAFAIVLVCGAGVFVYASYFYNKIFPGVKIEGTPLNGLTMAEAQEKIQAMYGDVPAASGFHVQVGDYAYFIDIKSRDLGYNTAKMAQDAWLYGRSGGFAGRISQIVTALRGGVSIEPSYVLDRTFIDRRAENIARECQTDIIEASYTITSDSLIIDRGRAGLSLDEKALADFIVDKVTSGDFADSVFELESQSPDGLDLLLIKEMVDVDMAEPKLDLEADPTGETISPARRGVYMDISLAKKALEATEDRFVTVPLVITQPSMSTEDYKAMLFRDVLGKCTTDFNAGLIGRTTNVLLAAGFCNGVILNPGDVFSYNETVGPRTYERGFMDAIVYIGASAEDGVGGGICQVSSTIYYACLRADLEIVERRSHSRMVTYVPLGEDATVAWGVTDYRFKNNTEHPIKIVATNTKNTITIELMGAQTEPGKTVKMETTVLSSNPFQVSYVVDPSLPVGTERVSKTGYSGYRTETYRLVYIDGILKSRTFENKSSYTRYDKVILHNPGETTTAPPITTDPPTTGGASTEPTTEAPITEPTTEGTTTPPTGFPEPTVPEPTVPEPTI